MKIDRINPSGSTQPGHYSHLVRAGNTLYISGQVSSDGTGQLVGPGDMRAQVRQVFENLKAVLASQGASFDHVVKMTIYTLSIEDFRKAGDVRQEYTAGRAPASTLVEINRLASPEYLVEVEAVAALEE